MTLVLGAAMMTAEIPDHVDWLRERDRDLEIQDWFLPAALEDPAPLVAAAMKALDGWSGRLGIHGPFFDVNLAAFDPEARDFARRRLLQGLEAAGRLGATQMVAHSPFSAWHHDNLPLMPGGREGLIARAAELLAPVLARAEELGVELVIENVEDLDPADRVALVDALAPGPAWVSLDTGHAEYAHVARGGRPVDFHVLAAGARLRHVHLQDVDGAGDRHWAPGRGRIAWAPLFEALAAHAPEARLILELKDRADLPEGARHLTGLGLAV
ncbi:sugar phosphate isomerase/epimerase [Albimonas sp. CAU 1670]|uniref:sugar phosphate isomerase/epimerase family protein n=1 Tax=Albimonas sp. CAU 1670 TaxID=3032599 RepID=UPI0023DC7271|nr:sugar phosphate isomerase/epimerase family protein [Albimonas sp. CAU 1670]MDF2232631.1 sugar phosphate isomerase/epimerase [Albimonas sp. CAU 1670]